MHSFLIGIKNHMLFLAVVSAITILAGYRFADILFTPTNIEEYGEWYSQSQYVLGPLATHPISDSELYVYAGAAYMLGQDPTTINFEHPPLGKYVYGLSFVVFGNAYVINLLIFPLLLVSVYLVSGIVLKNTLLRTALVALFAFQPIVFNQMQYALLDYLLSTILLLLFFVTSWKTNKKLVKYVLIGALLGLAAATKYPIPFMLIPFGIVSIISWRNKEIAWVVVSGLVAFCVYCVSYSAYFFSGHSFLDFLAFEKYRYSWWTGDRTMPKFLIFENLFTGKYTAWWDANLIQRTTEWNVVLPALFLSAIASLALSKKSFWNALLSSFGIGMVVVYGFASAAALRYLTLLLPFWLISIGFFVETRVLRAKK